MDKQTKKLKIEITKKLSKIRMKQEQVDSIINDIEGLLPKEEEKETKINYGTSCVRMEKNGKLLTEY